MRVGVAMITSASDALAFHERRLMRCGAGLKGQVAANLVRHFLANKGQSLDDDKYAEFRLQAKQGPRNKPALM